MKTQKLRTDILIIGGGTAGCYAALTVSENSDVNVLICEKAHIKRSGCLAAGVNALNAYIVDGKNLRITLTTQKRMQKKLYGRICF